MTSLTSLTSLTPVTRAARMMLWVSTLVIALAWLSACAQNGTNASGGLTATDNTKDRITASDEPESLKRARVRLELASAYFGRGQMNTALDEVKLSIAADPSLSAAFNLRGLIYASLGDESLAEQSFRRALQLDSRDADVMQNYGWYLCQQKRFDEAYALFNRALAVPQYLDSPRTLLTLGVCQARAGDLALAETTLMRAYEVDAGNPAVAVNLSEVLYQRGAFEGARFYIRRVNSLPEVANAQTLWLAARIENRMGNRQEADALSSKLKERFPQSAEAVAFERNGFNE